MAPSTSFPVLSCFPRLCEILVPGDVDGVIDATSIGITAVDAVHGGGGFVAARRGARRDAAAIGSIRVSNIWRLFEVEPGLCCDGGPSTGLDEVIRRGLRPLTGGPSASAI
jgi:hypothetical protein